MFTAAGRQALQLLLLTGARKSEIPLTHWEHVHLEHRILTVPCQSSTDPSI
ncbi:MAG: hypothetical protein ACI33N_01790 [Desulfovibrionaceae bacterium]